MLKTDAIEFYGGAQKLARVAGLKTRQAIYFWPKVVPDLYQYQLYYLSRGRLRLSRHLQRGRARG